MGLKIRRALEVGHVARRGRLLRVFGEVGVVGNKPATRKGAKAFRLGLEELGTTYVKLGQLLSSRPDLLPDVYIDELGKLVDDVPPFRSRKRAGSSTRTSAWTPSRGSRRSRSRAPRSRRSTARFCARAARSSSRCDGLESRSRSRSTWSYSAR